jgi:stage II sporulation protein M
MIFVKNVSSAALSIFLGAFWGIIPLAAAILNGVVVGVVISFGAKFDLMTVFWRLIPHGIFELPAIFLSWGMGMWLGSWTFRKDTHERLRERVEGALHVLFYFVLPLLALSAVIEGLGIAVKR